MKKSIILTLLLFTINSYSQVRTYVDTNILKLGEKFHFNVEIKVKENDKVQFYFPKDTINKFDVISFKMDTLKTKTSKEIIYTEKIELFAKEDGSLYIDPIKIVINKDTLFTNKLPLIVLPIKVDTTKSFFDIKGIAGVPYTLKEILTFFGYGVLGLAVLFLIVYFIFLRKKKEEGITQKEIISPYDLAKKSIIKLKQREFLERNLFKQFYTDLIDIIRIYLEKEFKVDAMESTTQQIITEVKNNIVLEKKVVINFEKLLINSDLVKFAKMTPVISEGKKDMKFIEQFIEILNKKIEAEKIEANGTDK